MLAVRDGWVGKEVNTMEQVAREGQQKPWTGGTVEGVV